MSSNFIMNGKTLVVAIDGPVGVGKSTLIDKLCTNLKSRGMNVDTHYEDIDAWSNYHGTNLLSKQCDLTEPYASFYFFCLQMKIFCDYSRVYEKLATKDDPPDVLLMERSQLSARHVFFENYRQHMSDEEIDSFVGCYERIFPGGHDPTDVYICLSVTHLEELYKRILGRGGVLDDSNSFFRKFVRNTFVRYDEFERKLAHRRRSLRDLGKRESVERATEIILRLLKKKKQNHQHPPFFLNQPDSSPIYKGDLAEGVITQPPQHHPEQHPKIIMEGIIKNIKNRSLMTHGARIIVVDGPVGAGKSTVMEEMSLRLNRMGVSTVVYREMVEKWTNYHGANLLAQQWDPTDRESNHAFFHLQMKIFCDFFDYINQAINNETNVVVLMERSHHSSMFVFYKLNRCRLSAVQNAVAEDIYERLFDCKAPDLYLCLHVTSLETLFRRIKARNKITDGDLEVAEMDEGFKKFVTDTQNNYHLYEPIMQKAYGSDFHLLTDLSITGAVEKGISIVINHLGTMLIDGWKLNVDSIPTPKEDDDFPAA